MIGTKFRREVGPTIIFGVRCVGQRKPLCHIHLYYRLISVNDSYCFYVGLHTLYTDYSTFNKPIAILFCVRAAGDTCVITIYSVRCVAGIKLRDADVPLKI